MKNKNYITIKFLFIAFTLAFIGCGENFFDSVVEIETPAVKPQLVVSAYWEAGSDSLVVFVSKSRGVKDNSAFNVKDPFNPNNYNGYDSVANAKVELFKNDQLLGDIPNFKRAYFYAKGKFKLDTISGVRYKIRVSAPNFETVEAEQTTQRKPVITQTIFKKGGAIFQDPDDPFSEPRKGDDFSIELTDNSADENYYNLRFTQVFWTKKDGNPNNFNFLNVRNIDPIVEAQFLNDKSFGGTTYRWRFFSYDYFSGSGNEGPKSGDKFTYTFQTFNRDWFLFNKTRDLLRSTQDSPFFSEPVILYTNIKGGYGIFSIYAEQKVEVILK